MKLNSAGLSSLAFAAVSGVASGLVFGNTAPLLFSSGWMDLADVAQTQYIELEENADNSILAFKDASCSMNGGSPLLHLRISGLEEGGKLFEPIENISQQKLSVASQLVIYEDASHLDEAKTPESCSVSVVLNSESLSEWNNDIDADVIVINLYDDETLPDIIEQLAEAYPTSDFVIQGIPQFEVESESILDQTTAQIKQFLEGGSSKREEINYDVIEAELNMSFDEINKLLDDEIVEIYDEDIEYEDTDYETRASSKPPLTEGSLFDKYSFFSDGIWMCTIVFLFLAWLLAIALGWLNSMKISYAAFDKPFDFEKKLQ